MRDAIDLAADGACALVSRVARKYIWLAHLTVAFSAHPFVFHPERPDGDQEWNDSRYRWVIVAAGGLLGCVAIGAMFSLPVLLQPIARDTGWSVTGISSAMTIGFLAMALASMVWGTLSDRFGPRPVVLTGRSCWRQASRWPAARRR